MKTLNLDDVKPAVEKVVKLNGKSHPMKAMTVGDFIDITSRTDELQKRKGDNELSFEQEFVLLTDIVMRGFETLSRDDIMGLSLEQLAKLAEFIQESAEEGAAEASEDAKEGNPAT